MPKFLTNDGSFIDIEEFNTALGYLTSKKSVKEGLTQNVSYTGELLAGYMIVNIIVVNKTANEIVLKVGTTAGGTDLISSETIQANKSHTFAIMKTYLTAQDVYISSANWNSAELDVYLVSFKVV